MLRHSRTDGTLDALGLTVMLRRVQVCHGRMWMIWCSCSSSGLGPCIINPRSAVACWHARVSDSIVSSRRGLELGFTASTVAGQVGRRKITRTGAIEGRAPARTCDVTFDENPLRKFAGAQQTLRQQCRQP